jgi:precorrin-6A/cobalt-precorrin-6A reductase
MGSSLRLLILGGSAEAAILANRLAERVDIHVISSLAGRVENPKVPMGEVRIGGFGGVDGLRAYLTEQAIDVVVDATHPFAVQISRNAAEACPLAGVPLLALNRPAWSRVDGDLWCEVPDAAAAAALVERLGKRIFLTLGRQELAPFAECSESWFLIRCIDMPKEVLPPNREIVLSRGPFTLAAETSLLRDRNIDVLVSKNSGGSATYSKIVAARSLGIPVVMITRPTRPKSLIAQSVEEVLLWISALL